jgi:pyruvate dehydrogenase (quinone)
MGGAPKFEESQVLPDVSYAGFARMLGIDGVEVDKPEDLAPAWESALAADRPVVLDIRCDPNVPPIPPHATFDQIKATTQAVLKGDPDAWDVFSKGMRTKMAEFFHLGRKH